MDSWVYDLRNFWLSFQYKPSASALQLLELVLRFAVVPLRDRPFYERYKSVHANRSTEKDCTLYIVHCIDTVTAFAYAQLSRSLRNSPSQGDFSISQAYTSTNAR
jgi:hypothetical protein